MKYFLLTGFIFVFLNKSSDCENEFQRLYKRVDSTGLTESFIVVVNDSQVIYSDLRGGYFKESLFFKVRRRAKRIKQQYLCFDLNDSTAAEFSHSRYDIKNIFCKDSLGLLSLPFGIGKESFLGEIAGDSIILTKTDNTMEGRRDFMGIYHLVR